MRNSRQYAEQAEAVMRLAARAASEAERQVYLDIAEGWRKLAAEAQRTERRGPGEAARRRPAGEGRAQDRTMGHPMGRDGNRSSN